MTYKEIINKIKPNLDRTIEKFKEELGTLRTGRATPALIETVEVECYGSRMPLKQLAAITAPEPRALMVQPWDTSIIKEIEKAIVSSRTGLSVAISGELIRVNIPSLNEESRKELVRTLRQKMEAARVSIRSLREQVWKEIQEKERSGEIREDDKFRGKDELQKLIDEYNKKVEDMGGAKEKEIMTI
ncbi:ribosome recycling factor [Patescibacteria group bacterium]|nr:ribosome recycling factor [Patescibacteria group bacterium]